MNRKKEEPTSTRTVRCAIYSRKSTEEGLQQEFNSLDAQRDAGEAYVTSQKHEGWTCLPDRYDDGGFTGANMDRPALQRLLADIRSGKIDCVIVYKVDRLSRSLLDFSRIIEVFDQHKVSFVSVTQAFNTATSMGRLVLNVLLSFAQFEREMISERTRDKIAAARRKGKWSGGLPVLGYTVVNTKLVVDEQEAIQVREIFEMYLERQGLIAVVNELHRRDWRTKCWTTKKGTERGNRPFTKNSLYQLLTNVVYIGKVKYKAEVHEGEHAAIVDDETFGKVQILLNRNGRSGGRAVRNKYGALLRGVLRCSTCNCGMSHTYTTKGPRQYRYYVCQRAQKQGWQKCPSPSIPAREIEQFVVEQIKGIGLDPAVISETTSQARRQTQNRIASLARERSGLESQLRNDQAELSHVAVGCPGDARLLQLHERIRKAECRMKEIEDELAALDRNLTRHSDVAAALTDFDAVWERLTPREQSRIVELVVDRVIYDGAGGNVSITFRQSGIDLQVPDSTGQDEEAAA